MDGNVCPLLKFRAPPLASAKPDVGANFVSDSYSLQMVHLSSISNETGARTPGALPY